MPFDTIHFCHHIAVLTPGLRLWVTHSFADTLRAAGVMKDPARMVQVLSAAGHRAAVINEVLDDVIRIVRKPETVEA